MIVSIESEGSNVRVEHDYIEDDMHLDDVFNNLIEPALLGFGFQKGSILDVCEDYLIENSMEFVTNSKEEEDDEEEELLGERLDALYAEDEAKDSKYASKDCSKTEEKEYKSSAKCSNYTSGYQKGYLAALREVMLNVKGLSAE